MNDEYLVYVKYFAYNPNGTFEYELFFSETPELVWGLDWDSYNPAICEDLTPDMKTISHKEKIVTKYQLKTVEETSCYSMEYAVNGIVALSWIDINKLEEYPEAGRCVLHYGLTKEETYEILNPILTNQED